MSIVAYVGRPGSGKSYGVVDNVIIPALKAGRTVVTNIPLMIGYLTDDYPKGKILQFKPSDPTENPNFFNPEDFAGCVIVIDEAWRYWSTGTKATQIPEIQKGFFTEHRHYVGSDGRTTEIVLVTQSLDQIAAFVRDLIEDTYRATKLSALGMSKSYRVDVFSGAQKGLSGGTPNRTLQGKYKAEVFKYYKSHTKNKTDFAAGMEEKADKRNNIFKSKFFMIGVPVAILAIFAGLYNALAYFTRYDEPKKVVANEQQQDQPLTIQKQQKDRIGRGGQAMLRADISREYLPLSEKYRIVGAINDSLFIWSEYGTRVFDKKMCGKFSNTKEDYCVLNGELVTWYTSKIPEQENRNYISEQIQEVL